MTKFKAGDKIVLKSIEEYPNNDQITNDKYNYYHLTFGKEYTVECYNDGWFAPMGIRVRNDVGDIKDVYEDRFKLAEEKKLNIGTKVKVEFEGVVEGTFTSNHDKLYRINVDGRACVIPTDYVTVISEPVKVGDVIKIDHSTVKVLSIHLEKAFAEVTPDDHRQPPFSALYSVKFIQKWKDEVTN